MSNSVTKDPCNIESRKQAPDVTWFDVDSRELPSQSQGFRTLMRRSPMPEGVGSGSKADSKLPVKVTKFEFNSSSTAQQGRLVS